VIKFFWLEILPDAESKVFITNSAPDIVNNLGFCIRQYLQPKEFW